MVEIARALAFDAEIVIMDEPTSALADSEVARLFRVIADLRKAGTTVLYISHKMNEIFELADQVVVLRDGQFVASCPARETLARRRSSAGWSAGRSPRLTTSSTRSGNRRSSKSRICRCPVRRAAAGPTCATSPSRSAPARCWGSPGCLGAGRTELLEAIFGASPYQPTGTIRLEGKPVRFTHPDQAIKAGIAMTTEDRKTLGLFDRMTVAENITLRRLPELTIGPLVDPRAEKRAVDLVGQGAGDQDGGRRRSGNQPLGRQPAEVHPRPLALDRAQGLVAR